MVHLGALSILTRLVALIFEFLIKWRFQQTFVLFANGDNALGVIGIRRPNADTVNAAPGLYNGSAYMTFAFYFQRLAWIENVKSAVLKYYGGNEQIKVNRP